MSGYKVDYRELQNCAKKILEEADRYDQTADKYKDASDDLMNGWEGPASVKFREEQEEMYLWYKKMAEVCREFADAANVAASNYLKAEMEAKAAINR